MSGIHLSSSRYKNNIEKAIQDQTKSKHYQIKIIAVKNRITYPLSHIIVYNSHSILNYYVLPWRSSITRHIHLDAVMQMMMLLVDRGCNTSFIVFARFGQNSQLQSQSVWFIIWSDYLIIWVITDDNHYHYSIDKHKNKEQFHKHLWAEIKLDEKEIISKMLSFRIMQIKIGPMTR